MVKINKIYTRTGDQGETGLVGGARIPKDSLRVESYGNVDELNAYLGLARTIAEQTKLTKYVEIFEILQNELFDLGSELATPQGSDWTGMIKVEKSKVEKLEEWIDTFTAGMPELRSFVLPGGNLLNAYLHVARTVCRRAERSILKLSRSEPVQPLVIPYINRLSDLLFAMARAASADLGSAEYLWQPGKTPTKSEI